MNYSSLKKTTFLKQKKLNLEKFEQMKKKKFYI